MVEVIFGAQVWGFDTNWDVYPFAKEVSPKINELQAIISYDECASDAQKILAPPKRHFKKKIDPKNLVLS